MRKAQKKQIEDLLALLEQAHSEVKRFAENKSFDEAMNLIGQCQDGAVQAGELIEKTEGENAPTIAKLEEYCETLYEIHEQISADTNVSPGKLYKRLHKSLIQVENSVRSDIKIRLEMVFMPYKASMWDSLESVWMAADADPDCDAYVVPIPYYDKNQDGSFGAFHYEGDQMPDYVPVVHYDAYDLMKREPDAVFIHNPYDQFNRVTSVDPRFYSYELKKYTECLVYIPYYATSGGMSEGQASCMAYYFADYIIVQAEKFCKFYDSELPREKLVPLGSPKFDKVIRLCQNPPEPPKEWKEKMAGKKVYFYNTSINGMLANTEAFLKKMEYVFQCFTTCEHACLLWRPHPLLESTFDSMRAEYKPIYENLKRYFFDSGLGIYDDTPEIEPTIALCDAYIGDAGTSVTSLFGIAGKPVFILNNTIHHAPEEDDWRGEIITDFFRDGYDDWKVTQGNKLYHATNGNYRYEYYCDLSEYAAGGYYLRVIHTNKKVYVCPVNAQDILVVQDKKIIKRIALKRFLERNGAFCGAFKFANYIFLVPNQYPAIVRLDTRNDEVSYLLYDCKELFVKEINGQRRIGGTCIWKQYLFLASPDDEQILAIDMENMKVQHLSTGVKDSCGCMAIVVIGEDIWLLPYEGVKVTRWNPDTGETRVYSNFPDGFQCHNRPFGYACTERPFSKAIPYKNGVLLSPSWGNMFIWLDRETGETKEWKLPFDAPDQGISDYYPANAVGYFVRQTDSLGEGTYRYFHMPSRKLYDINPDTGQYQEIPIIFDAEELREHVVGFDRISDWIKYSCMEGAFHSLPDFLEDRLTGQPFDREKQICSYQEIITNRDGTCGKKTYEYVRTKCSL